MNPTSKKLYAELTPAQQDAVAHIEGPLLILAGPGSGKTRVVTHRIANMLDQGIPASQIVALTFTNKAADEMNNRVAQLAPGQRVWMSTFHRFGARLMREFGSFIGIEPNFTIYDTSDSKQTLVRSIEESGVQTLHYTPDRIATVISNSKNNLITAEKYKAKPGSPLSSIVAEVYPVYQKRLRASNAVDFDDLLIGIAEILYNNPEVRAELDERFKYILVDEYQDTNRAQYVVLRALSVDYPNLAATGDPDQSIYGWRGANLSNILEFEQDFPEVNVVRLEKNYRSTKQILRVADQLIKHNEQRKEKQLYTDNAEGAAVKLTQYQSEMDEAANIAWAIATAIETGARPRDFAIFFRVNALSRALERALREANVPFQLIRAQEFFHRKEIKDILSYCQLVNNPRDDVAFLRAVATPRRGIGKTTLERIRDHATENGLSMLESAREAGMIPKISKRIAVMVAKFVALIDRLGEFAHEAVEELLGNVVDASGYRGMLVESDSEEDLNRLANIEELLTDARQFDEQDDFNGGLEAYLERLWLVSDLDDWDTETDKVSLMTLHAAKGLEFPHVFIPAFEQGLLPHERSASDPVQLEEERRLAFVGITRAEQTLHITYAKQRDFRGQRRLTVPSSFLMEMPREFMEVNLAETSWGYGNKEVDEYAHESHKEEWEEEYSDNFTVEGVDETLQTDEFSTEPKSKPTPAADLASAVTTGAALAGQTQPLPAVKTDPNVFAQGMAVLHPGYGPGKIIALSGSNEKRTATVRFATAGEKKFILVHSPLRPVK